MLTVLLAKPAYWYRTPPTNSPRSTCRQCLTITLSRSCKSAKPKFLSISSPPPRISNVVSPIFAINPANDEAHLGLATNLTLSSSLTLQAGQRQSGRLRFQSYPREKWFPEVHHHCPGAPCLIVGTQTDLRDDPQVREKLAKQRMQPVRKEDGERMAKDLGAVKYVECSALTQYKWEDVFDEVGENSFPWLSISSYLQEFERHD